MRCFLTGGTTCLWRYAPRPQRYINRLRGFSLGRQRFCCLLSFFFFSLPLEVGVISGLLTPPPASLRLSARCRRRKLVLAREPGRWCVVSAAPLPPIPHGRICIRVCYGPTLPPGSCPEDLGADSPPFFHGVCVVVNLRGLGLYGVVGPLADAFAAGRCTLLLGGLFSPRFDLACVQGFAAGAHEDAGGLGHVFHSIRLRAWMQRVRGRFLRGSRCVRVPIGRGARVLRLCGLGS